MGKQSELKTKERNMLQAKLMAAYEANGGNLKRACKSLGITQQTHYLWVSKYPKYANLYNELRTKARQAKVQMCEDIADDILHLAIDNGVENLTRDQLKEVRAEAEFQRRTLASDTYSTKEKHVVQDETGRPTWNDVVATIKGTADDETEGGDE